MAKLYLVPTPIGNLKDITLRAIEVLKDADIILAEDTRKSGILLKHYSIDTPLKSHHKFNEHRESQRVCNEIMNGKTFALISDAGTPGISDPGYLIVKTCIDNNIDVEVLPGATAFVPALANSGLPSDRFCFEGFLPPKKGRLKRLGSLTEESRTIIFYESPHRLVKLLEQLSDIFGKTRKVSVSRELSKIHEEHTRGTIEEVCQYYNANPPRGEIVVVLEGK